MLSLVAWARRWPLASWLFLLHASLIVVLYAVWLSSKLPYGEREMLWIWALMFDFPVSLLYSLVPSRSHLLTAAVCIVIGGCQWAFLGVIVDLLRRRFQPSSGRGAPNI